MEATSTRTRLLHLALAALLAAACGDDAAMTGDGGPDASIDAAADAAIGGADARIDAGTDAAPDAAMDLATTGADAPPPADLAGGDAATTPSKARALADKLGPSHAHFLVGMGNDGTNDGNDPAYSLGAPLDLHYLTGLSTLNGQPSWGWTTWNSNPDYARKRINEALAHNMIPMFAYYCMTASGENNLPGSIGDTGYMTAWWKDYIQLLDDIRLSGSPVVVIMEPDFWGYLQFASIDAGGPNKVPARVAASAATECKGLPEDVTGFGRCIVALARSRAPKALIGFHASSWSTKMDVLINTNPSFDVAAEAAKTATFFRAVGGDTADFVSTDLIDRDAGCYEVGYTDGSGNVVCNKRGVGLVYWDETNTTLPHFHQAIAWAAAIAKGVNLPILWWQVPFGVPSSTPGGTPGRFRDNKVRYLFTHVDELVAAGGVGVAFGTGAGGQTFVTTDNGQFKNFAVGYFQAPHPL